MMKSILERVYVRGHTNLLDILTSTSSDLLIMIIPAYREPLGLKLTLAELKKLRERLRRDNVEVISICVVRPSNDDDTLKIAKELCDITIVQRSKGKAAAVRDAILYLHSVLPSRFAKRVYVGLVDADFTYDLSPLPAMVNILRCHPRVGMVIGRRVYTHNEHIWEFGNRILRLAHSLIDGVHLSDPLSGLRLIRGEVLMRLDIKARHFELEVELNYAIKQLGYLIAEVPTKYRLRVGEKKLRIYHALHILRHMFVLPLIKSSYKTEKKPTHAKLKPAVVPVPVPTVAPPTDYEVRTPSVWRRIGNSVLKHVTMTWFCANLMLRSSIR